MRLGAAERTHNHESRGETKRGNEKRTGDRDRSDCVCLPCLAAAASTYLSLHFHFDNKLIYLRATEQRQTSVGIKMDKPTEHTHTHL